jgi:hypothetical protein
LTITLAPCAAGNRLGPADTAPAPVTIATLPSSNAIVSAE